MLLHSFLDEGMETNEGKGSCLSSHSLQLAVSRCKPASLNFIALALFFLSFFFFTVDNFKFFIEFVTILFLFYILVSWPQGMWDLCYLRRDWSGTPCNRSLNHWTTRKSQVLAPIFFFNDFLKKFSNLQKTWTNSRINTQNIFTQIHRLAIILQCLLYGTLFKKLLWKILRDGDTRPPDLPFEKPVCRSGNNT